MRLRDYLDARNLTMAEFAGLIGVAPMTIHRYLNNGRIPRTDVMLAIIEATEGHVTADDFFCPDDEMVG
jgi:transcriptional regulator with XRE-family HTH domain